MESQDTGEKEAPKFVMSISAMAFLTVCAIFSLRNLPGMAEYGWSSIFILSLASACFFIPSALVSAELTSTFPENGGVYVWVKEAFGPKWGFLAIFMEWVQNLPWYPACLTFVGSALAYVFNPQLASDKWFIFFAIQVGMWSATLLNSRGMRFALFLSNFGVVVGTFIPGLIIILMGLIYFFSGNAPAISFHGLSSLLPDFKDSMHWMLLAGLMVSFAGMEMSSVHVRKMANPSVNYPKAVFLAAFIVIALSALGSLAIAWVVPQGDLSLAAGVCQAFEEMLRRLGVHWMTPILSALLALGAFSMVANWINGPSNGLLEVAQEGYIPPFWHRRNKNGMPMPIFYMQAVFASLLSVNVLIVPTISNAFWILSALCSQLYMVMYLLMFAAAIRLRYSRPDIDRPYRIPGGKVGIWAISGIAFLTSLLAFICGFIPPENILDSGLEASIGYCSFLGVGVIFFVTVPLIFFRNYQKRAATNR